MHERIMSMWLETAWKCRYIETPKDSPALIDAIITDERGGTIRAVAETKCRYNMTLAQLRNSLNNEWLMTWTKVQNAMQIAMALGVPCVGLLYLVEEKTLLAQKLSDQHGNLMTTIRLESTETQATINGGKATRNNAFIDMSKAKVHHIGK